LGQGITTLVYHNNSSKGLFVAMPSYKAGNGEYKDICFPVTKEFREQLNQAVIGAYNQALAQSQNTAPHHEEVPKQNVGMQMGGM
jgi:stage V sporulation protein G